MQLTILITESPIWKRCLWLALLSLFLCFGGAYGAQVGSDELTPDRALGRFVEYIIEPDRELTLDEVTKHYEQGEFVSSTSDILSLGIGIKPIWLRFDLKHSGNEEIPLRLTLGRSWFDEVDIYLLGPEGTRTDYHLGDALPFSQRPIIDRFFSVDHHFLPGITSIYFRIDSTDAMVVPIFIRSLEQAHAQRLFDGYSYGLFYGALLILLLFNLILYVRLFSRRYAYFSLYLIFFMLLNMGYTGHAFMWLWPNAVEWKVFSVPILATAYCLSGLLFATRFLDTKATSPWLYRGVMSIAGLFIFSEVMGVISNSHYWALATSMSFVGVFSILMLLLGVVALQHHNRVSKYFLLASVTHTTTMFITLLVIWGVLPYSTIGYRAVDIGMVIDASLLFIALADQFREIEQQKTRAEQLARVDSLTGLYTRRAFYEMIKPIWSAGRRNQRLISALFLDIDHFKEVNDRHGHGAGDQVLRHVGGLIQNTGRGGDIISRWGGDEFVVLLPDTNLAQASEFAERCRTHIAALRLTQPRGELHVTASIGIALHDWKSGNVETLIAEADRNLYLAKDNGRDRVYAGGTCITESPLAEIVT
jgi:diguanylate cyclase (GGDEF)-like protein